MVHSLRIMAASAVAIVVALLLYAWRNASSRLEIVHLTIRLPQLPVEWEGLRIAHLSDFHVGGRGVTLTMLRRARGAAERYQPDVIALTGDFYDNGQVAESEGLFQDWPHDSHVVAVLGNHDDRGGDDHVHAVVSELERAGVRVLRNESAAIDVQGRTAWVVGVDDPYAWRMDDDRAFRDVPDEQDVLLYLAHSPAAVWTMPIGQVGLLVSGHTHGGQIRITPSGRIPFVERLRRIKGAPVRNDPPVFRGIHRIRGAIVVISNGLGVSQVPFRFRAAPQVILIELTAASEAEEGAAACDDVARYVTNRSFGRPGVAAAIVPLATRLDNRHWRRPVGRRVPRWRGGKPA